MIETSYEFASRDGYGEVIFTQHTDGSVTTRDPWPDYMLMSQLLLERADPRFLRWENSVVTFWDGTQYEVCAAELWPSGSLGFRRLA